ncbi:sensor of ECF-type sigma factor [Flavobacteriaceae bacterium S0825]|uniref:sensor of ECF-type sigma factor n=1 Tax=Gaetbulibacter sp. S0825 TaxID=2720084 RepID=UPI00142FD8F6|nr:sensor of ECF-type sigma factor [Gaetbulibacter sp. S0825]MCK0109304.1 sensor of ECF-type sigma factor [Flavobacteriaceae bacterium S0825]NIX64938.1 sensor of ECF-type sigma factor [Gaetbulibacter sp. S0825]
MKKIITPLLLLIICFSSYAQRDRKEMQEKIKAQKVAFITDKLDLTSNEAQKFWPVYNAFEERTNQIRRSDLYKIRSVMKKENLTEKEAQDILVKFMAVEEKMHNAKQQLIKDLGNVISPQKIIKLKIAEDAFNRKLMETYRQRREQRMKNKKP